MATRKKDPGAKAPKTSKIVRERVAAAKRTEVLLEERRANRELVERLRLVEAELAIMSRIKAPRKAFKITRNGTAGSEATAFLIASDWHVEEVVISSHVNGMNEFNRKVCEERVKRFFSHGLRLVEKERNATRIETLVLALLGTLSPAASTRNW